MRLGRSCACTRASDIFPRASERCSAQLWRQRAVSVAFASVPCSAPAPPRCVPGDGHRDHGCGVAAALLQLKHAGQGKSCNAPRSWVTGWWLSGGERRAGVWQRWRFQAHSKLNGDGPHTLLLLCEQLGSYTNITDAIGRQLQIMHTWPGFWPKKWLATMKQQASLGFCTETDPKSDLDHA